MVHNLITVGNANNLLCSELEVGGASTEFILDSGGNTIPDALGLE